MSAPRCVWTCDLSRCVGVGVGVWVGGVGGWGGVGGGGSRGCRRRASSSSHCNNAPPHCHPCRTRPPSPPPTARMMISCCNCSPARSSSRVSSCRSLPLASAACGAARQPSSSRLCASSWVSDQGRERGPCAGRAGHATPAVPAWLPTWPCLPSLGAPQALACPRAQLRCGCWCWAASSWALASGPPTLPCRSTCRRPPPSSTAAASTYSFSSP